MVFRTKLRFVVVVVAAPFVPLLRVLKAVLSRYIRIGARTGERVNSLP